MRARFALPFLLTLLASCAGPPWVQTVVTADSELRVGLEHRVEEDGIVAAGYDHPQALEAAELRFLLDALAYSEPRLFGGSRVKRVFQADEAARLAPALSTALARADGASRIWFTSYNLGDGTSIFRERRTTEGVLFQEPGGVLNIAFSIINEQPEFDEDDRGLQPGQPTSDPVKITRSTTPLVAGEWYSVKLSADGVQNSLWAVVERSALREAYRMSTEGAEASAADAESDG